MIDEVDGWLYVLGLVVGVDELNAAEAMSLNRCTYMRSATVAVCFLRAT